MPQKVTSRAALEALASKGLLKDGADPVFVRKQYVCDIERVAAKEGEATDVSRRRKFVISTASPDRDNDTVAVSGWLLDNYRKNPVVLWAHDYRSLPIGKAVEVGSEGDKLVAVADFADHPFAETVLRLIDGGFLRATSVGFRPEKYMLNEDRRGLDFVEQELLEFSVVPVPANPEALLVAREFETDVEQLRAWAKGILDGEAAAPVKKSLTDRVSEVVKQAMEAALAEEQPEPKPAVTLSVEELSAQVAAAVAAKLAPQVEEKGEPCPACQKRGRVLSGANEARLRQAKDHLDAVLAQVASAEEDPEATAPEPKAGEQPCCAGGCEQKSGNQCKCGHFMCAEHTSDGACACCATKSLDADVLQLESEDVVVLQLDADPEEDVLAPEDVVATLRDAVSGAVGELVREQTRVALNRLTGRVD